MRYQVTTHCPVQALAICHEDETSQPSHSSGEAPSSTNKNGDPPKATGSPGRKSSCHKCSPPLKKCHGSLNKDSLSSSSKRWDKSHKDKEDGKSLHKCVGRKGAPPQKICHGLPHLINEPSLQQVRQATLLLWPN